MLVLFWLMSTYALLVMQTTLAPALAVGPFTPNLFIALAVPCWYGRRSALAICAAAAWGLAVDLLGTGPVGINLITFTVAAAILQQGPSRETASLPRMMTAAAAVITMLVVIEVCANWPPGQLIQQPREAAVLAAGQALYSLLIAIAALLVRDLLARVLHRGGERRERPAATW